MVRLLFGIRYDVGTCKTGTQLTFVKLAWEELE